MHRTGRIAWLIVAVAAMVVSPAMADQWLIYTQRGIPGNGADIWTWCDGASSPCSWTEPVVCDNPEGGTSLEGSANTYIGMGVFLNIDQFGVAQPEDLSAFQNGSLKFWVKAFQNVGATTSNVKAEFQCRPNGFDVTYTKNIADYGWAGDGTWQEIEIPIADFFAPNPVDVSCLQTVLSPFMITNEQLPFFDFINVDYARWETENTFTGATPISVSGRQIMADADGDGTMDPFVVNAMAYAPIAIGEDWRLAWEDRPDRYLIDFPLIKQSGANAVRLYAPIVSKAMLDAAWAEGLFVIPTFGVDGVNLTCAAGQQHVEDRFVEFVNRWKGHPALLAWIVGNEVNTNLAGADICTEWYPTLDAMAVAAHTAEGAAFHPIGTAVADNNNLGDVCIGGCSDDTAMPNVDFWGVQLYRGCSFGTAFSDIEAKPDCERPIVVTEFGADAFNRPSMAPGMEDQQMQADCFATLLDEARQNLAAVSPTGVSSGQVIFEWADEWWKAECTASTSWSTHDTCASFQFNGYPDPNVHEEWWGISSLVAGSPDVRNLRAAHTTVTDSWYLSGACDQQVVSHTEGGTTEISYTPSNGASDHTLYYGSFPIGPNINWSGSRKGLGASGTATITDPLPNGSLYWAIVGRTATEEGCYGSDSSGNPRNAAAGSTVPQSANGTCSCP